MNIVIEAIHATGRPGRKGTQKSLQQALEAEGKTISQPSISYWVKVGYVPDDYVSAVSKVTGIAADRLCMQSEHAQKLSKRR